MLEYVLKSAACMAVLLLFYQFFLERENMHVFKRFYLIGALTASLLIPTLVFTTYVEATPNPNINSLDTLIAQGTFISEEVSASDLAIFNWERVLWGLYVLGLAVFGFRFLRHLFQIIHRIQKNPKQKLNFITRVLLKENLPPHTFFHYVFLNKTAMESNAIPSEVLLHEETHAKQYHSLDVLFIELLQVVLWFNPLLYHFKRKIKLNHEFLADHAVLRQDIATHTYQNTLLSYLSKESKHKYQSVHMAHAINYSSIKKRFTIMKKRTSKMSVAFRTLLVFPIVALLLFGFSEKKIIPKTSPLTNSSAINVIGNKQFILLIDNSKIFLNGQEIVLNDFAKEVDNLTRDWEETDYTSIPAQANFSRTPVLFLEKVEKEFQKTHFSMSNEGMNIFPEGYKNKIIHKGASREQMKEYNELAKSHNLFLGFGIQPRTSEIARIKQLYDLMSEKQKRHSFVLPDYSSFQKGASREQMKEYNALAKKYNAMSRENMRVKMKEVERMKYIYSLMSDKQRADAEPFPSFPVPPEPPTFRSPPEVQEIPPSAPADEIREVSPPSPSNTSEILEVPPPPPAPKSPLEHIKEVAEKGAKFYFEGKEISSKKAIALIKNNEALHLETKHTNDNDYVVRISTEPIVIKQ